MEACESALDFYLILADLRDIFLWFSCNFFFRQIVPAEQEVVRCCLREIQTCVGWLLKGMMMLAGQQHC